MHPAAAAAVIDLRFTWLRGLVLGLGFAVQVQVQVEGVGF